MRASSTNRAVEKIQGAEKCYHGILSQSESTRLLFLVDSVSSDQLARAVPFLTPTACA